MWTGVLLAVSLMPELALADSTDPIGGMLTGVLNFFNTGVARSVATIAVIAMGVAAYIGKISWELAMKIGAGMILTFGASALVTQFGGYAGTVSG
jgi:type IV secretion system protein VirB2